VTTSSVAPAPTTTAPTGPPTTPAASSDTAPPDTATVAGTTVSGRTARGFGGRARAGTANAAGGSTTRAAGSTASAARITQTVTSVISVGAPVGLGDVLYTVDSQPVVALSGALPAWRSMSTGSTDGADVQQLEQSLVSMGYDPAGDVVVDEHFDSHTKAMVERWQKGLGATATGEVSLGSVVFVPTTTTVDSVTANVGDKVGDGDTIMTLAEASQQVVIDVPDGDQALIVPGLPVTIGSSGATGTVSVLRSAEQSGAVVVEAVITPDAPITGATNGSTIAVAVDIDSVDDALIIPAQALLSHLDGTYAVEVEAADGSVTWHDVDLLGVSGPNVGIRGDGLAAGMNVLLPV